MASSSSSCLRLLVCISFLCLRSSAGHGRGGLTAGFTPVRLADTDLVVQKPYDVPLGQRYRLRHDVRQLWVYAADKPFNKQTTTKPRTEIRIRGHDYSSGVWQFEGYGYVPAGTSGMSVMQIKNDAAATRATTMMLQVYDGELRYYDREVVEEDIYERWFRLNVVHDVGARNVTVFVDGTRRLAVRARGAALSHYFKFGVYAASKSSGCMESRWRNVTIYTRP